MVIACSVKGCSSKRPINNNLSFHKFPNNPKLLEQWLMILKTKNWKPKKNSKICSAHFLQSDFYPDMGHSRLRETAVPSQNLPLSMENQTIPEDTISIVNIESGDAPSDTPILAVSPELSMKDKSDIDSTQCTCKEIAKCIAQSQQRVKMLEEKNKFLRKLVNDFINTQTNGKTEQDWEKNGSWSSKVYKRNLYLEKKLSRLENKQKESTENIINTPVNYDHHYAATPQSLKRRLLNYEQRFHKQRRLLSSRNHQLHRSMIKQSELRNILKEMEKRKDIANDNVAKG